MKMTENIARYDKESDMYKILPGSYITTYLYDGSSGNLYITFASGKKVIFHRQDLWSGRGELERCLWCVSIL